MLFLSCSSDSCGVRGTVNPMTKQSKNRRTDSERARVHVEMLEAAFTRPGVREAMKVYEDWREKDRRLDAYRAAMTLRGRFWNWNHTTTVAPVDANFALLVDNPEKG